MIGERLGKWSIEREVGRGGMGRVYLARDESSGLRAAVKVLVPELAQEQGFLDRFGREIEALSTLDHPNIVKFYEAGEQDHTYYYAMEFVEGEDFEKILTRVSKLPWKEVLDIAMQICPALKHAHDHGIIHRDLKPHNLLRSEAGVVKLSDFGIARVFASRQLTQTGGVVGTADYLSPEQALGKTATKKSDLYSLGVVIYRMITGWTPFHGASSAELLHKHVYGQFDRPCKRAPELPHDLDEIICQLLEKDPAKRPADALVLYRELERIKNRMERRAQKTEIYSTEQLTLAEEDVHKKKLRGPGTGTLMSRLMRKELEDQASGGPLLRVLNQPIVLGSLFVLVVGFLFWTFWLRPQPEQETSIDPGQSLMRRRVNDALVKADSEAKRFYEKGLRLLQEGDVEGALRVWKGVVTAYKPVEADQRWVDRAEEGIKAVTEYVPKEGSRPDDLDSMLHDIQAKWEQGDHDAARARLKALATLYRDDPSSLQRIGHVELAWK